MRRKITDFFSNKPKVEKKSTPTPTTPTSDSKEPISETKVTPVAKVPVYIFGKTDSEYASDFTDFIFNDAHASSQLPTVGIAMKSYPIMGSESKITFTQEARMVPFRSETSILIATENPDHLDRSLVQLMDLLRRSTINPLPLIIIVTENAEVFGQCCTPELLARQPTLYPIFFKLDDSIPAAVFANLINDFIKHPVRLSPDEFKQIQQQVENDLASEPQKVKDIMHEKIKTMPMALIDIIEGYHRETDPTKRLEAKTMHELLSKGLKEEKERQAEARLAASTSSSSSSTSSTPRKK